MCSGCKKDKLEADFPWRNRNQGIRQSYCKSCKSDYNKTWYDSHKAYQVARTTINRAAYKRELKLITDAAKDVPCKDCGRKFPAVAMDFDHIPGKGKEFTISSRIAIRRVPKEVLQAEIAKCEVVCACCHRIRTAIRLGLMDGTQSSEG